MVARAERVHAGAISARPMPCVARGVDAELVELLTAMAFTVAAAGVSGHE